MQDVIDTTDVEDLGHRAEAASDLMKALSHKGRLMILCRLANGEASVAELEAFVGARQAAVSQQLARLRSEGIVGTRREGTTIRYFIADDRARVLLGTLYQIFCSDGADA